MSRKTLLMLFAVFAALGAAASYSVWAQYLGFNGEKKSAGGIDFSGFSESAAERISIIKSGSEEKDIYKQNGEWKINGFGASQKTVDGFFEAISSLEAGSLVSKNEENHKKFEVTGDIGFILSIFQNDATSTFIVGKRGHDFNSFYAKKSGSPDVYLMKGALRDKLSLGVSAWRDKTVVNIDKESIQKVEIISGAGTTVVSKKNDSWQTESSGKASALDSDKADKLLAAFGPLEASGFLTEKERKEFGSAGKKTTVRVLGSEEKILAEINMVEKESEWWAQAAGNGTVYKIPKYKISNIVL